MQKFMNPSELARDERFERARLDQLIMDPRVGEQINQGAMIPAADDGP